MQTGRTTVRETEEAVDGRSDDARNVYEVAQQLKEAAGNDINRQSLLPVWSSRTTRLAQK